MNSSKILLIGNGPSALNQAWGKKIDEFDGPIVRFNNFQLKGYQEFVGTRTNILARRACDDVKLHSAENLDEILCFVTYCKWTHGMKQVAKQVQKFYGKKCIVIDEQVCKKIGKDIGLRQPNEEWASIGALCVGYLALQGKEIYIYGFDFLRKNEEGTVPHYFPKTPKDAKYHSSLKEEQYIQKLTTKF